MNQAWCSLILMLASILEVKAQLVEFEAPFNTVAVQGTLVPVVVANRNSGVLVAQSAHYELIFSSGLQVYTDAVKTIPVTPGTRLTTHGTGYDTLWVTGATEVGNQAYVLSITGSSKNVYLTFTAVPTRNLERMAKKRMSSRPWKKTPDALGRIRAQPGGKFQILKGSRINRT